jgi:hypothetical protein
MSWVTVPGARRPVRGDAVTRRLRPDQALTLQRFALPSDSAEAVQPNQL